MKLIDYKSNSKLPEGVEIHNSQIPKNYRKKFNSKNLMKLSSISVSPMDNKKLDESIFSRVQVTDKITPGSDIKKEGDSPVFRFPKLDESQKSADKDKKSENFSNITDNELCVICFANPQNAVYLPCGHGSTCITCSLDILEKGDECCICREIVETMVEIDLGEKRNDCYRAVRSYIYFNEEHDQKNGEIDHLEQVHREVPEIQNEVEIKEEEDGGEWESYDEEEGEEEEEEEKEEKEEEKEKEEGDDQGDGIEMV